MPGPRTFTAAHQSVIGAADRALEQPEGVLVRFLVSNPSLGSMDACALAARAFQQNFTSLKARTRRGSMRIRGETHMRDTDAKSPYESLACQRLPLPNEEGWSVRLCPANFFIDQLDIIDIATGKPLSELNEGRDKLTRLMLDAQDFKYPLTRAEWDWLNEQVPVFFTGGVEGGEVWRARPTE